MYVKEISISENVAARTLEIRKNLSDKIKISVNYRFISHLIFAIGYTSLYYEIDISIE